MIIQLFKKSPQDMMMNDPMSEYRLKHHVLMEGNRTDSLTHVMHLFDEKRKYPPAPTLGPLPIKANGAIVVHRPTPNTMTSGSPSDSEDEEEEEDDDDNIIMKEVKVVKEEEENSTIEDQLVFSMANSKDVIDLMRQENNRLRRQLLIQREHNEEWEKIKSRQNKTLKEALHTIHQLEKKVERYQNLLPSHPHHCQQQQTEEHFSFSEQSKRRQSTGSSLQAIHHQHQNHFMSSFMPNQQLKQSYEHKLHILLKEIDAMQTEETNLRQKIYQYKNEKERLERIISYKDETIRQLVHEREVVLALNDDNN